MSKNKKSELRERVRQFAYTKCKSVRAFEESIGFSNGTISQYTDNTTRETLSKIKEKYPDFDVDFMLTGAKAVDVDIYKTNTLDEFIRLLFEERKRVDEERVRHDEQINRLIALLENKNGNSHPDDNIRCVDVAG